MSLVAGRALVGVLLLGGTAARADAGPPRLAGVIVAPAYRSAIFEVTRGAPTVVEEGERIGGYVVRAITLDGVQVERDGQRVTIEPSGAGVAVVAARQTGPVGVIFGQVVNPQLPAPD